MDPRRACGAFVCDLAAVSLVATDDSFDTFGKMEMGATPHFRVGNEEYGILQAEACRGIWQKPLKER